MLSCVQLFVTPWTAAHQIPLSFTVSLSLLKLMSIELVMLSNHLTLYHPLLLPSIFPSIRVFSSESALHIRWPRYWSFSFSISPSSEYSGLISLRVDWLGLLAALAARMCTHTDTHTQDWEAVGSVQGGVCRKSRPPGSRPARPGSPGSAQSLPGRVHSHRVGHQDPRAELTA